MTLRRLVTPDGVFRLTGEGYATEGSILGQGEEDAASRSDLQALLWAAAGCNDAELSADAGKTLVAGDPTEVALLVAAAKVCIRREALEAEEPRLRTLPFDSDRKRMTVVRERGSAAHAYVKGEPEAILARSMRVRTNAGDVSLDAPLRARLEQAIVQLAADALRVPALAERRLEGTEDGAIEEDRDGELRAPDLDPSLAAARALVRHGTHHTRAVRDVDCTRLSPAARAGAG